MNIFVTGTDTDVGKTVVSSWLCMHTQASYWKPIQTGGNLDQVVITKFSPSTKIIPEVYILKAPLSPFDAAKKEHVSIGENALTLTVDKTVIEGAGGALVPIKENFYMADLVKLYRAKAIIVARSKLGVINHALMTGEVLKNRGIDVLGIVINGLLEDNIKQTIEYFSRLKILAVIPESNTLADTLRAMAVPSEISEVLR
ncbi:MAG: dethiobiotin synthase [Holosporales bacterium]|nr:dethiobiotin synthase [Holosporales bacterium]